VATFFSPFLFCLCTRDEWILDWVAGNFPINESAGALFAPDAFLSISLCLDRVFAFALASAATCNSHQSPADFCPVKKSLSAIDPKKTLKRIYKWEAKLSSIKKAKKLIMSLFFPINTVLAGSLKEA